jgi:glycosyltransferase involved in cell wall biosynthesis
MTTSVLIPAYNAEKTIGMTLKSVLSQTKPADEIIVLNDGSTDGTLALLNTYKPRVTVVTQDNRGVASARNALYRQAKGDLLAFLDHDDIWHPKYLETQLDMFHTYPDAVGFFTGHLDFRGYTGFEWDMEPAKQKAVILEPITFLTRYNRFTGQFASMSYCCIPRSVLHRLGDEPFHPALSGVDDSYLCTQLPLLGPVVYTGAVLVAYRQTAEAQSVDRLKTFGLWVEVFELLKERYGAVAGSGLGSAFTVASALKRRCYGKVLMGAGKTGDARAQFRSAATESRNVLSIAKSVGLLLLTYAPARVQPAWPPPHRL